ncbi:MAG TPA: class II aldolase/adducin family protein [Desulfuromonadales bacterium]|nr:class II aldolase/adducin family protein [Desulfuromonadales bacterium]
MSQREGVIKFELQFKEAPPLPAQSLREIGAWRRILWLLNLVGRDPARYEGLGYGNVSLRLPPFDALPLRRAFVVSGTQTGDLSELGPEHFALVTQCDPQVNRVTAEGPIRPSSEALTHGALYAVDADLRCVLHVHSPELWHRAAALGLPCTDPRAAYGTPAMAAEVARLYADPAVRGGRLLAMGGHEDGLVAFGASAEAAGSALVGAFARALALR